MRGGEGIVDVKIAERGEAIDHVRRVLLLAGEEAGIFEQADLAGGERGDRFRRAFPRDETHRAAEHALERLGDEREAHLGIGHALGPAEMGEDEHDSALVRQFGDGRHGGAQAGIVGDGAVGHRHVQILAHQHALAVDVAHIV